MGTTEPAIPGLLVEVRAFAVGMLLAIAVATALGLAAFVTLGRRLAPSTRGRK